MATPRISALATAAIAMAAFPAYGATVEVTIENLAFKPAEITVSAGDRIVWINKDVVAHTATADGGFDVVIEPKKSAGTVVKKPGRLNYHCRFHPNMTGRIDVGQ